MATVDRHAHRLLGIAGIFQTLRVSAAIREGAHPRVWDGTGWHALYAVPNLLELEHGVPGFVGGMAMDPDDSARLFLGFHAPCTGAVGCFSESKDSGATWKTYCGDGADKSPVPREVSVPCP